MQEHSVSGDLPTPPTSATTGTPDAATVAQFAELAARKAEEAAAELRAARAGTKRRAGYTTNKSRGTPKAKRRMVAASRHRNRKG